jgi:hypothetical protein
MNGASRSFAGWPVIPVCVMMATTPVLTALVVSLPIAWMVNHIFAANAIHAIFGVEHLGYWRIVGLFAIWFAIQFNIKFNVSLK